MIKNFLSLASVAALSLTAVACGGGIDSGLDSSKQASSLTDDEVGQMCEATAEYMADEISTDLQCKAAGITAGALALGQGDVQAACEEATSKCKEESDGAISSSDCDNAENSFESCGDATVGDVETCIEDMVSVSKSYFEDLPDCGGLEDYIMDAAASGTTPDTPEMPESCSSLPDGCVYDDSSDF